MNALLIATHNKAKLLEIQTGLHKYLIKPIKIISLKDLKITKEPKESGKTFKENAEIKVKFYAKLTGLPTIADDAGLIIPVLNNEPGVKSRRWLRTNSTDDELINYTLSNLQGQNRANRTAFLEVCLCYFNPETKKIIYQKEKIKGYIAFKPSKNWLKGYPFRALFVVDQFNKYYDELTEEEHEKVNHRLKALKRLVKKIKII